MTTSSDAYWNMVSCAGPVAISDRFPIDFDEYLFADKIHSEEIFMGNSFTSSSSQNDQFILQASSNDTYPSENCHVNLVCSVCSAPAHGYNFDQITCESCKAFFRRNALRNMANFKCRYSGNCVINVHTRRQCTYCRLKKCFDINMRKDWIRTEEERTLRLLKNYHKEQRKLNKLPLDHRSLDAIPIVARKKKRIQPLLSKYKSQDATPCKIELSFQTNIFAIHRHLALENQILINNVINTHKLGVERANCSHIAKYSSSASLTQFLNDENVNHESLIYFYKLIPEFKQFDLNDQILLVKCNLKNIIHLHLILVENFRENPHIGEHMSKWITKDFHRQMSQTRTRFDRFMAYPQVLKLTLVAFIFSTNLSAPRDSRQDIDFRNRRRLFEIQNFYVSLLWRYLLYLFDEQEAQRSMSLIVMQILRYQLLMDTMDNALQKYGQEDLSNPLMRSVFRLT
ncbi:unnamed protein product [Adineta ricciae]|uniref:Nuclear receptor domain-containing protein n=1 Tax=Adineta ricciae TaxID=249248 RepID=A0A813Y5U1_ADIRI|nr:unnamed protein product [Adineta ricciae]CAF1473809.1 unnamed protein product [Adineta ricciae]